MIEFLNAVPDGVAGMTIVGVMFLSLFTAVYKGIIIPRPIYEERMADKDKQIETLLKAREYDSETIRESNEGLQTIVQMLEGMQQNGGEGSS
mgnify:CR=1 FL=1